MPPKGTKGSTIKSRAARTQAQARAQARAQSEAAANLANLNLGASSSGTRPSTSTAVGPRNTPATAPVVVERNYEPKVNLGEVRVVVWLYYGDPNKEFPEDVLNGFETTMGRSMTEEQVHGLIYNNEAIRSLLEDRYGLDIPEDISYISFGFTNGARQRFHTELATRADTIEYQIWAGEVEGGDVPAKALCDCRNRFNEEDHYHEPQIQVHFEGDKVEAVLNPDLEDDDDEDEGSNYSDNAEESGDRGERSNGNDGAGKVAKKKAKSKAKLRAKQKSKLEAKRKGKGKGKGKAV